MKRASIIFIFAIVCVFSACKKNQNEIPFIDFYKAEGVYLPVEYITELEKTKNNYLAMKLNKEKKYYYVIAVKREEILYDDLHSDCLYNIPVWDLTKCKFEFTANNEWLFTDKNGYVYKKITDDIENWYSMLRNYMGSTVLRELINKGDVIIKTDAIVIPSLNNKELVIISMPYNYMENANLEFKDMYGNYVILEIKNDEYVFYKYDWENKEKKEKIWEKKL